MADGRTVFLAFLPVVALLIAAPVPQAFTLRDEHLLRGGLGLLVALLLGVLIFWGQDRADSSVSLLLWLLLLALLTGIFQAVLPPRVALGATCGVLAGIVALALAFRNEALPALDITLRLTSLWGMITLVVAGVGFLGWLTSRWGQLVAYSVTIAALAAWWQWVGPLGELGSLSQLGPLEVRAVQLIPVFILIGGGCQLALALLLPQLAWRVVAQRDLAAHLFLIGVPLAAQLVPVRRTLYFEGDFRVAWLAILPIGLLLLRLLVAASALLQAAKAPFAADPGIERRQFLRLALAFFLVCFSTYWGAAIWRGASFGLIGDEPSYLAAAMSLWNDHNLELASSMFSPEMTAVVADPEGERELHVYEDASTDRMLFSRNFGTPRRDLYFPLVADRGMTSAIELVNPDLESAGGDVVFRDSAGQVVESRPVIVPAGKSLIAVPPANPAGPLSATITVGKPIGAAARLTVPGAGTETYFGTAVAPRHCLPLDFAPGRWQAQTLIQNGFPTDTIVRWTQYTGGGQTLTEGRLTIPGQGLAALPTNVEQRRSTLCLAADGPIAAALVARARPGLVVVQSAPAAPLRVDIPERHTTLGYQGERQVIVHNPSAYDPVALTFKPDSGPPLAVSLPPHGTWSLQTMSATGVITTTDPVMVNILEYIGGHAAAVTPEGTAATTLRVPVIAIGQDGYAVSQIELTNPGPEAVQATLWLTDGNDGLLWSDKIWVQANGTSSKAFWYTGRDSRVLRIEARTPLTATLLQREIRSDQPVHGLGLSLALIPGYALAGFQGVLATVAALAALVALALFWMMRRVGIAAAPAVGLALLVACSSPLSPAAVRLYAEVGGTFCLLLAALLIDTWRIGRWRGWVAAPLAALSLGGAVLFHGRLIVIAALIAGLGFALALWRIMRSLTRQSRRRILLVILTGVAVACGVVAAFYLAAWYEPRLRPDHLREFVDPARLQPRVFGILFDRGSGLLPMVPVLFLVLGGLVWLVRRRPFWGWLTVGVVVAQFIAVAVRFSGWETWGPPGRYIYPAVPFWGLALAAAWVWGFSRPVRWLGYLLALCGVCVTAFSWWLPLGLHYGISASTPYWFTDIFMQAFLGGNPFMFFPTMGTYATVSLRDVLPWLGAMLVGGLLAIRWGWLRDRLGRQPKQESIVVDDTSNDWSDENGEIQERWH